LNQFLHVTYNAGTWHYQLDYMAFLLNYYQLHPSKYKTTHSLLALTIFLNSCL